MNSCGSPLVQHLQNNCLYTYYMIVGYEQRGPKTAEHTGRVALRKTATTKTSGRSGQNLYRTQTGRSGRSGSDLHRTQTGRSGRSGQFSIELKQVGRDEVDQISGTRDTGCLKLHVFHSHIGT